MLDAQLPRPDKTVINPLTLQTGVVIDVKIVKTTTGAQTVNVDVQCHHDAAVIRNIPIDTPLFAQHIPVVGQLVLLGSVGQFFTRILAVYGERPFDAPIQPGEALIEGHGGGFMYLNNDGDVMISDETSANIIRMLSNIGITMTANSLSINVSGVGQLNITPANTELGTSDQIELIKFKNTTDPISPTTKIILTNNKIIVDGATVEIGLGNDTIKGGSVVSASGVVGPHSYDLFTGAPIPGSGTVTETIFPRLTP